MNAWLVRGDYRAEPSGGAIGEEIADKLIARHPYVFADADVPDDLLASWEQRKRAEKGRTSALDGIPDRMSALTRAGKVLARAGSHGVPVSTDASAADIGERLLGASRKEVTMAS